MPSQDTTYEQSFLLRDSHDETYAERGHSNQDVSVETDRRGSIYSYRILIAIGILALSLLVASSVEKHHHSPRALKDLPEFKKSGKKKDKDKEISSCSDQLELCEDGRYSTKTLKTAYDMPFSALFKDARGQKKFEASDVIIVNDSVYAVCDSSWAISKFGSSLQPFSDENVQIGDPAREEEESGYEAIFHDDGIFYVVRESVWHSHKQKRKAGTYRAIVEELLLSEDDYEIVNKCSSEFVFEGNSKGFEGAISVRDTEGELVILGLCEGNYCAENTKDDTGNGRIVAMKKGSSEDGTCTWKTIKQIPIPKSADFQDYSSITLNDDGRVAISSQEDSVVWIGRLNGRGDNGLWSLDEIEFDDGDHKVYQFPKDTSCNTIYCNIEGIHWLDGNMLVAVSDKMKSKGKQDFSCFDKDQSVHVMVVP